MLISYISRDYAVCDNFEGVRVVPAERLGLDSFTDYSCDNRKYVLLGVKANGENVLLFPFNSPNDLSNTISYIRVVTDLIFDKFKSGASYIDLNKLLEDADFELDFLKSDDSERDSGKKSSGGLATLPEFLNKL